MNLSALLSPCWNAWQKGRESRALFQGWLGEPRTGFSRVAGTHGYLPFQVHVKKAWYLLRNFSAFNGNLDSYGAHIMYSEIVALGNWSLSKAYTDPHSKTIEKKEV